MSPAEIEGLSLEIRRLIKAPRERVYAAWTNPEQLREWFGPPGVRTKNFAAEVCVGGKYRWDVIGQDGEEKTVRGEYRELEPGRRVVFTWRWDDDEAWENHVSVVTVELTDGKGGTELRLKHEKLPSKESRGRHHEGWSGVLDRLESFVS